MESGLYKMKRMIKWLAVVVVIIMTARFGWAFYYGNQHPTKTFIQKWLTNPNGTFATYMKEGDKEDSDLVKGREALSETLGIWMEIALIQNNKKQFQQSYEQLVQYFVAEDGFVHWKLNAQGTSEVFANALVDDLRICYVLIEASKKWNDDRYLQTAIQISTYIETHNLYKERLTDYYAKEVMEPSHVLTLSYIEPDALNQLNELKLLDATIYSNMLQVLEHAQMDHSFFPKAFDVENEQYIFDNDINMIDQSLVALYRARAGFDTTAFLTFIRQQFTDYQKVYGLYNRETAEPLLTYESTSAYGWLILYCVQLQENVLALQLYERMKTFQETKGKFKGGYAVYDENTHIFDTIVPLLAESELKKQGLVQ